MSEENGQSKHDCIAPYKWKPGQSGNPSGRKPRRLFMEALSRELDKLHGEADSEKTRMERLAEVLVEMCIVDRNVKAMAIILPHIDPQRARTAFKTTGNINILAAGGHAEVSDVQAALDQFVADELPKLVAGMTGQQTGHALTALAHRVGGISARAGSAMLDKLMMDGALFPTPKPEPQ